MPNLYFHGAKSLLTQVAYIQQGIEKAISAFRNKTWEGLGQITITDDPLLADLIYINSAPYDPIFDLKVAGRLKDEVKIICNILDFPEHLQGNPTFGNYNVIESYGKLLNTRSGVLCDAVSCISPFVQSQIQRYFPRVESTVIYNPIKPVNSDKRTEEICPYPQYKAMMVGRLCDPNKRSELAIRALFAAGIDSSQVAMVGSEYPGWGDNLGIVDDEKLNDLYNSVDYVVCCSHLEGLCLPLAEGIVAGALPVVCQDLTTFSDFNLPRRWGCYPNIVSVATYIRQLETDKDRREFERQFSLETLAPEINKKMSCEAVAKNILDLFSKIVNSS